MAVSKRAQEAISRIYDRIRKEIKFGYQRMLGDDIFKILEDEYEKEGGDINDLPGIK